MERSVPRRGSVGIAGSRAGGSELPSPWEPSYLYCELQILDMATDFGFILLSFDLASVRPVPAIS